jgi:hypothetical protein
MNAISNRDPGDEHADPINCDLHIYIYPDLPKYQHDGRTHQYACTSDRYDHTHIYAHGDAGDGGDRDGLERPTHRDHE